MERMALETAHREVYVIRRCPLCKGQCEGTSWSSHYGDCPNRNKTFAIEEIEAVPSAVLSDALEFAAEGWAYASEYFIEKWGAKEEMERLRGYLSFSATDSTGGSDG